MSGLIYRDKAIEAIENVDWYHQNRNKDMVSGANSDEHQAWYKSQDIYEALENVPSARPKGGKWIKRHGTINCSVCKRSNWSACFEDTVRNFNYCPNCGCAMTKE